MNLVNDPEGFDSTDSCILDLSESRHASGECDRCDNERSHEVPPDEFDEETDRDRSSYREDFHADG